MGGQAAGIVDLAARNDESHAAARYPTVLGGSSGGSYSRVN
jgi:hypothetical protein